MQSQLNMKNNIKLSQRDSFQTGNFNKSTI